MVFDGKLKMGKILTVLPDPFNCQLLKNLILSDKCMSLRYKELTALIRILEIG